MDAAAFVFIAIFVGIIHVGSSIFLIRLFSHICRRRREFFVLDSENIPEIPPEIPHGSAIRNDTLSPIRSDSSGHGGSRTQSSSDSPNTQASGPNHVNELHSDTPADDDMIESLDSRSESRSRARE